MNCEFCGTLLPKRQSDPDNTVCRKCDVQMERDWLEEEIRQRNERGVRKCDRCGCTLNLGTYFNCRRCLHLYDLGIMKEED